MAVIQCERSNSETFDFGILWPNLAGPAVALFAIFAVHFLTRRRDKEKTALEIHKIIHDAVTDCKDTFLKAWESTSKKTRLESVQDSNWRLQQIGSHLERLRKITVRRNIRLVYLIIPVIKKESVSLTRQMAELRETLTQDPFSDPSRKPDRTKRSTIEQALGDFLVQLDTALLDWLV